MKKNGTPRGWAIAPLGGICVEKVEQREPGDDPVPYIDIGSINRDTKAIGELQQVTRADAPTRARQCVRAGDVLVSMTRPNLNAVARVPQHLDGALASTGFDVLRPTEVLSEWVFNRVRSHDFVAGVSEGLQGVVYPAIRPHDVRKHECPIPPFPEQQRIVEAIESYFTRLDDAVATLDRVQRNLKRYRASVLKAAAEGRLVPTEAELARAKGRDYEPASVLLERILAERRRQWQESGGRGTYQQPLAPAITGLPPLPEGWCWASIDQVGDVSGGLTKTAKRAAHDRIVPYLRVANVYADELRLDDVSEIGIRDSEMDKLLLKKGDLLVVEGNGSIDQIGRVAVWDGSIDGCVHQNHLIKVRFCLVSMEAWALRWLLSPGGRQGIEREASSTSGLHTLSISKVARLPIPLCPLAEQPRITSEVDRLLSIASGCSTIAQRGEKRAARLRQSILKWAFEGKLADQDPGDEPASVLLERIRTETAARMASDTSSAPQKRRGRRGTMTGTKHKK